MNSYIDYYYHLIFKLFGVKTYSKDRSSNSKFSKFFFFFSLLIFSILSHRACPGKCLFTKCITLLSLSLWFTLNLFKISINFLFLHKL